MTAHHDSDHEKWAELAAGYALDALEPDEQALFETHLASCAECRRGLDEHEFVAAQLGALAADATETAPSWADLRASIVGLPATDVPRLETARQRRRPRVASALNPWVLGAAAGAAVLAAAGVIIANNSSSPAQNQAITACAASASCHVIRMPGAGAEQAAVLVTGESAVVVPTALPSAPAGRVYVLWQMRPDGTPTALAILPKLTKGTPSASQPLKVPYAETSQFAISLEPNNVVPTQPTDVIATSAPTTG